MSSIPEALQRLHDALPADPVNDGPIGVDSRDVRVLLAWAPILGLGGPEAVVPPDQCRAAPAPMVRTIHEITISRTEEAE